MSDVQLMNAALLGGTSEALKLYGGRASMFSPRPRHSVSASSAGGFSTPEVQSVCPSQSLV